MIYFDHLPLDENIIKALSVLKIDYVFQPIFYPDGKTIFSREALMRPEEVTVTELIDQYMKVDQLHVLEVATFFGAMQAYQLRGYTERLSINSFPTELFTPEEAEAFDNYFGDVRGIGIVEILEYPELDPMACKIKKEAARVKDLLVALDDFGVGICNMSAVDLYQPNIVKLDRSMISNIDSDQRKQEDVEACIMQFHTRNMLVVGEGVETRKEFEYLVGLGVDLFQGYYLAKPQ